FRSPRDAFVRRFCTTRTRASCGEELPEARRLPFELFQECIVPEHGRELLEPHVAPLRPEQRRETLLLLDWRERVAIDSDDEALRLDPEDAGVEGWLPESEVHEIHALRQEQVAVRV